MSTASLQPHAHHTNTKTSRTQSCTRMLRSKHKPHTHTQTPTPTPVLTHISLAHCRACPNQSHNHLHVAFLTGGVQWGKTISLPTKHTDTQHNDGPHYPLTSKHIHLQPHAHPTYTTHTCTQSCTHMLRSKHQPPTHTRTPNTHPSPHALSLGSLPRLPQPGPSPPPRDHSDWP